MVGNDVTEDMVAQSIGMQVFLLTDCLINKERKISQSIPGEASFSYCSLLTRFEACENIRNKPQKPGGF